MRIALCVASYRRPDGLRHLLRSIAAQHYAMEDIAVFVADNDAERHEAFDLCRDEAGTFPFTLTCAVEPFPGISHARNRSLALAKESGFDFDVVGFIDDDTEASPFWLRDMAKTMRVFKADVVVGRVGS